MTSQPIRLEIDYAPLHDRRSVALRLIIGLPVWIILGLLVGAGPYAPRDWIDAVLLGIGGLVPATPLALMIATALTLTIRRRYPRWWFEFHAELLRFAVRVLAYLWFLTDRYPAIEEETDVRVHIADPPVANNSPRWLPLVKWLLVAPHYLVLYVLGPFVMVTVVIAWIWVLFTRRYPETLFDFVTGVIRWSLNVYAYAFLLITDDYPPFRLKLVEPDPVSELVER